MATWLIWMLKLLSTRTWYKNILMIFKKKYFKNISMQISKGNNKSSCRKRRSFLKDDFLKHKLLVKFMLICRERFATILSLSKVKKLTTEHKSQLEYSLPHSVALNLNFTTIKRNWRFESYDSFLEKASSSLETQLLFFSWHIPLSVFAVTVQSSSMTPRINP